MPALPTPGGSSGTWGDELNAFLEVVHNADGTVDAASIDVEDVAANFTATNVEDVLAELKDSIDAVGGGATRRVPVFLNTTDSSGNGYAGQIATANIRQTLAAFLKDADGSWYGKVHVPLDYSSGPKIILRILANNTSSSKVARVNVHTHAKTDGEVVDASLTSETAQDITMPTTAYQLKEVTFTLASSPAAGDELTVRVQHEGNHANDTLDNVDLLLYDVIFEYTSI